jgi:hypothetical protein
MSVWRSITKLLILTKVWPFAAKQSAGCYHHQQSWHRIIVVTKQQSRTWQIRDLTHADEEARSQNMSLDVGTLVALLIRCPGLILIAHFDRVVLLGSRGAVFDIRSIVIFGNLYTKVLLIHTPLAHLYNAC